ncbi:MAG: accessory gene regulator B family protein [Bacillota bacterium]
MSITKEISNSIYVFLDRQGLVTEPDKIRYCLDYLSASITKILMVLAVGLASETLLEVTICMLSFGLLRQYSGGAHMGNSKSCLFVMLGIYYTAIVTSYLLVIPEFVLLGMLIFELAAICLFAPADTAKHPIIGVKHKKRLKIKSLLVYTVGMLVAVWLKDFAEWIILSFFIQAVTLTPFAYKITNTQKKEVSNYA